MNHTDVIYMELSKLSPLPDNPRKIKRKDLDRLIDSIKTNGFWPHRPLAVTEKNGIMTVIAGNQRMKAAKELRIEKVPVIVYSEITKDEEKEIILRDNINNGDWDVQVLSVSPMFKSVDFNIMGIGEIFDKEDKKKNDCDKEETSEKSGFKDKLVDVLYESDNEFEIPNLRMDMQAGNLELPFSPWGANSRLRKDVSTYHFYVDDYRFESLFKDPIKLLMSGCKSIVEPNCSLHDQTPIAYGLHLIYKKRWLSRWMQECGVRVYADLNVSHKFIEYNKMGIPKGYNAFFTRGLDGWIDSLKLDFTVAKEISGLDRPNLIVYGGGRRIQEFCRENGLLYVTDFINAKK